MRIGIYNARVGTAESGGTETFLREVMKRLVANNSIVLLTGEGELHPEVERLDIEIVQVSFTPKESRWNDFVATHSPILPSELESLTMFWNAKRTDKLDYLDRTTDVISSHYYMDNILLSRTLRTPSIFRFPGMKHPSIRWKTMARIADPKLYLSNSESTHRRIEQWLDVSVDGTVYAGVDTETFSPEASPAFQEEETTILFVGRLDEGKGLRDLIDAAQWLDSAKIHIIGDGTLAGELRERAIERGVSEMIVFHGPVPHHEIHQYYAAADIFCLPSHHESLGLVNLEAMATGTPVVTTRIDAIEEYINDGENGVLVPPGDVDALSDALDQLAGGPDLRTRLSAAGRSTASQFSWSSQAKKMEAFYEEAGNQ